MKMALLIMSLIRRLREEMMGEHEEIEMTWRQYFIKMTALGITFLIGLMFFEAIEYVMQLVL